MLIKLFFLVKGVSLSRTSSAASVGCNVCPPGPTKLFYGSQFTISTQLIKPNCLFYFFSFNLVVPSLPKPKTKHLATRYIFIFTFILLLAGAESVIQAAFNEWEKTCIRFRKRTTERNYFEFFKGSG